MTQAAIDSSLASPRLERQWAHGLRCLFRFTTTPSDLANSFEAMFALAGPVVDREFRKFAAHPTGARLLAEQPRRDLNALLCDRAALAEMPEGSLGDAYLQYLGGEDMGPADYFLEAANLDEKAARFGWSDDHLWYVKRMANSHDLFHILAGYDRDIIGEVGVIGYTAGQVPLLPLRLLLPFFVSLKPSQPWRWFRYVRDAYRHGRNTPPLDCVDYASMLPMPLEEARREIGVPSLESAHREGLPTAGGWLRHLESRVTLV
jgi:ubiquinone biosynthesis protein COQ4